MPQASQETLDAWPHGEGEALKLLQKNFTCTGGWFSLKDPKYEATPEEVAAMNYLIEEWDYAYKPVEGKKEEAEVTSSGEVATVFTSQQQIEAARQSYQLEMLQRREPRVAMLSVACWNPSDEELVREAAQVGKVLPGERIQIIVESSRLSFATRKELLVGVYVAEKRLRMNPASEWKGAQSMEEVNYRDAAQEILFSEWSTLRVESALSGYGLDNVIRDWIESAVEEMYAIVEGWMEYHVEISNARKLVILRSLIMAKGSFAVVRNAPHEKSKLELDIQFAALVEPVAAEPNDLWFLEKPKENARVPWNSFKYVGHSKD